MSPKKTEDLIYELIHDKEKELASCVVQEWIYQREAADPKNITKAKAMDGLAIYQTRIKSLEQHIEILKLYLKEHDID